MGFGEANKSIKDRLHYSLASEVLQYIFNTRAYHALTSILTRRPWETWRRHAAALRRKATTLPPGDETSSSEPLTLRTPRPAHPYAPNPSSYQRTYVLVTCGWP